MFKPFDALRCIVSTFFVCVFLVACGGSGGGGGGSPNPPNNPPANPPNGLVAPTGVEAEAGHHSVTLTWNAVTGATGYRVYRGASTEGPYTEIGNPTATSFTDTGLTNGTTYFYVVRAHDATSESPNSHVVSATPTAVPPAVPAGLEATDLNDTITVKWMAVANATSYRVYRSTTEGGPYEPLATVTAATYLDEGLTDQTTYYYVVSAFSEELESEKSQEVSATIDIMDAPTGLAAKRRYGLLSLSWSEVEGATSYKLFRSTAADGPYTEIEVNDTKHLDTEVEDGVQYHYFVRAYNGPEESHKSTQISAVPHDPTDEFSTAQLGDDWETWDGYAINNPTDDTNHATFGIESNSHLSIAFPGGVEHNMFWLDHAAAVTEYAGSGIYETKLDTDLTGSQQFGLIFRNENPREFIILMLYVEISGSVKAYVERFTDNGGTPVFETFPASGAGIPLGVSIPVGGPFYVRVAVTDEGQPEERMWTFSWSQDGANWEDLMPDVSFEEAGDLNNIGEIASVGVFAGNNPNGLSAFDARFDYFRYYRDEASMPVPAPTNVVARGVNNLVELWWDAASGVDSYNVYAAETPDGTFTLVQSTNATTLDHAIPNGTTRSYRVTAVRDGEEGQPSTVVTATAHDLSGFIALPENGLVLALSASELQSQQLADGDPVAQWPNLKGPKISARGSSARAPTFVASGLNGLPVVRFDGVDDFLQLPSGFKEFQDGASIYVVMRPTALDRVFKILAFGNGEGVQTIAFGRNGNMDGLQYVTNDSTGEYGVVDSDVGLVEGEWATYSVLQDGGEFDASVPTVVAKNNIGLDSGTVYVPPFIDRNLNYIGKSLWPTDGLLYGDIAEIILYNRKVDPAEHDAIRIYLSAKYALP